MAFRAHASAAVRGHREGREGRVRVSSEASEEKLGARCMEVKDGRGHESQLLAVWR